MLSENRQEGCNITITTNDYLVLLVLVLVLVDTAKKSANIHQGLLLSVPCSAAVELPPNPNPNPKPNPNPNPTTVYITPEKLTLT